MPCLKRQRIIREERLLHQLATLLARAQAASTSTSRITFPSRRTSGKPTSPWNKCTDESVGGVVCVVIYYIHAQIVTQMNKLGQALCGSLDSFGRVSFHVPVCVCDCFAGGTRNDRPDRALLVVLMMTKLALPS